MSKLSRENQILIDALGRLIDAIYDAEYIDEYGESNLPGDIEEARYQAERVLAKIE